MVKKIITVFFYTFLFAYIVWEFYWYNKVGLTFIKWHTHLLFPFILFLFLYYIFKLLKASKKHINTLFVIYLCFHFFEIFVQITGIGKTPNEKKLGYYSTHYPLSTIENYYWIDKPNTKKILSTNEFKFTRFTNKMGYSDIEWKEKKEPDEIRILSLGDSFTEGDGAHKDSTYPSFLKHLFKKENFNVSVLNAGKCGSDPFFNFMNYKDRLINYHPDIILQTISTQDIMFDLPQRGGLERFEDNLKLSFQHKNKIRKLIFALCYTSRPIYYAVGYKRLMRIKTNKEVISGIKNLFNKYESLTLKNDCKLIIVIHPLKEEVENGYNDITKSVINFLKKKYEVIDLRSYYKRKKNCYWIEDSHFNSKGYEIMAKGIYENLKQYILSE